MQKEDTLLARASRVAAQSYLQASGPGACLSAIWRSSLTLPQLLGWLYDLKPGHSSAMKYNHRNVWLLSAGSKDSVGSGAGHKELVVPAGPETEPLGQYTYFSGRTGQGPPVPTWCSCLFHWQPSPARGGGGGGGAKST